MSEGDELTTLRLGDTELVLAPGIGGSVVSFRVAGADYLRPGSRESLEKRNPLGLAAFPLFPFSGRIANGRFRCGSRDVALLPNFPPEPHAIHGQGWQSVWRIAERGESSAALVYDHDGREWPWVYRAEQRFALIDGGIVLSLSLTNLDDSPMPGGLGWHPYFPKEDALLSADVREIWPSGEDPISQRPVLLDPPSDLRSSRAVSELRLDNGFNVGAGASVIRWPSRTSGLELTASAELRHLVVFTPPTESYFCVEPVSHAPNAVNSALAPEVTGYRELHPSETLSAKIELRVKGP
jgi:aldose 1-epimerase